MRQSGGHGRPKSQVMNMWPRGASRPARAGHRGDRGHLWPPIPSHGRAAGQGLAANQTLLMPWPMMSPALLSLAK